LTTARNAGDISETVINYLDEGQGRCQLGCAGQQEPVRGTFVGKKEYVSKKIPKWCVIYYLPMKILGLQLTL